MRVVRKYLRVPDLGTGFELDGSELKIALLRLQGVLKYARIFLTPTQSRDQVPASLCAVRASRMNDLAVTVTLPRVQHARIGSCEVFQNIPS